MSRWKVLYPVDNVDIGNAAILANTHKLYTYMHIVYIDVCD